MADPADGTVMPGTANPADDRGMADPQALTKSLLQSSPPHGFGHALVENTYGND